MGVLRLNGKAYGGGIDVIEVTQAQYNALPESKLSDDILYVISDSVNGSDGYPPLIYSDEEREIGVWRDGKPLYQKTFNLSTTFTITSTPQQLITITDIPFDTVLIVNANVYDSDDNRRYDIPNLTQATPDRIFAHMYLNKALNPCTFFVNVYSGGLNYAHCTDLNVTVQYTKTTDTKGSGRWTTQGTLAQHYSTTERLIGTWIDGKPLYEKTISYIASTSVGVHDIETLSSETNVVKIEGIGIYQNQKIPIPYYGGNNDYYLLWTDGAKLQEYRGSANGFSGTQMYVTIQYTKTTD